MSTEVLSSKERILTAMRGGTPDRVPIQLGVFSIAPRMSNAPFWDTYYYGTQSLYGQMVQMFDEFGLDGYLYTWIGTRSVPGDTRVFKEPVVTKNDEYVIERTTVETSAGTLWQERTFPKFDAPTTTRGYVKTIDDLRNYIDHFFPENAQYDTASVQKNKTLIGDRGVVGATIPIPGMHDLIGIVDGKLEQATYFAVDHPGLIDEYREKAHRAAVRKLAQTLDAKPDYIEIAASGLLTLSTPEWVRRLSLPTIQELTRMCRQAGVPSELHSCGKERYIIEMCANETELDSINPLQPPPMGDCDLAEVKRTFGKRLCIKGNVGVTEPMLTGSPDDVEKDVLRCLVAAKEGGGYILFTEEGLGRDTPFENIRKFVEVGREYGKY